MNGPLVAVIVPTFRRKYLLRLLYAAFIDQKHTNWRIYLSYVHSEDVLASKDARIIPVKCPTKGSSSQRNHGLGVAKREGSTKYVCFFDDDDLPFPDYLSTLVAALEKNPDARAVSCNVMDPHRGAFWRHGRDEAGRPIFPPIKGTTPGFLYRKNIATPSWDKAGWFQNSRYSARVLGSKHSHTGDVHVDRVLLVLLRDQVGGLHCQAGEF